MTTKRSRPAPLVAGLALLLVAAFGCTPEGRVTTIRRTSGETLKIYPVDDPVNPLCTTFCKRLAACWYAVPDSNPVLRSPEVYSRCEAERAHCRTPGTDLLCCGGAPNCEAFARCKEASRDVVVTRCPAASSAERAPVDPFGGSTVL